MPSAEGPDNEQPQLRSVERIEVRELGWVVRYNRVILRVMIAFVLLWSAFVVAQGAWWFLLFGVVFLAMCALFLRMQDTDYLVAEGDTLTIRNLWRTHRLERRDIAVISVHERRGMRPGRIEVRLRDGSSVEAMVADPTGYEFFPGRTDLPDIQTRLSAWLRGASEPRQSDLQ